MAIKNCWDTTTVSQQPVGTKDYVVIFFSPSQSVAYGTGGISKIPPTSKRAGFSILQTDNLNATLDPQTLFTDVGYAYSLPQMYGSQGQSISSNAFLWASHLDMVLIGNEINLTGSCYHGEFPYSSLLDEYGAPGLVSVDDLIRMGSHKKLTKNVSLMCSMVNNNLPTNAFTNDTYEIEKGFSSELVSYMVIHKAFTPIDALTSSPF